MVLLAKRIHGKMRLEDDIFQPMFADNYGNVANAIQSAKMMTLTSISSCCSSFISVGAGGVCAS